MKSKLTLSIAPNVIERAKKYTELNHTSVSEIVENYLKNLQIPEIKEGKTIAQRLQGCLADSNFANKNYEEIREMMYKEKYDL